MKVKQSDDGAWFVVAPSGYVVAEGLSNAEAWRIADLHDRDANQAEEKRRRISIAVGQW